MHCGRYQSAPLSRREMLARSATGFGAMALAALAGDAAYGATTAAATPDARLNPLAPRPPHFPAKAKNVIFLFMDGGPSQVDTFDPKPRLDREHGEPIKMKVQPTQFNNVGNVLKCPWKFRQYGQSGIPVSDLFPHVATCVDDLAIIRSMIVELLGAHQRQLLPPHRQRPAGPAQHGRLGHLRPGQRVPEPARLRRAQQRHDSARRLGLLQQRLPAGHVSRLVVRPRRKSGRRPVARRSKRRHRNESKLALLRTLDRRATRAHRRRRQARIGDRQLRAGLPHADGRART